MRKSKRTAPSRSRCSTPAAAGATSADDFGGEAFQRTFAVNVQGVANCVNPALNAMRARGRGQIAIVGSLIGYGGVPNAYAYGPSKAAAISLAVGLKFLARAARASACRSSIPAT